MNGPMRNFMERPLGLVTATAFASACLCLSCSDESAGMRLVITAGQETSTLEELPSSTFIEVRVHGQGTEHVVFSAPWPVNQLDLPAIENQPTVSFEVRLLDSDGTVLVRGQTASFDTRALSDLTIPIFVGPVNQLSRPAGSVLVARRDGVGALVAGSFVVVAGGRNAAGREDEPLEPSIPTAYDLSRWQPVPYAPLFPRTPRSMAPISDDISLLINDSGADWFDFSSFTSEPATTPFAASFADVAGGISVEGDDGEHYVVGATRRDGSETASVIRIAPDRTMQALTLTSARVGAAATWMPGRGLVVIGGSSTAAGVEVLAKGGSEFVPLDYGPIDRYGSGAAAYDTEHVLVAGGSAGSSPSSEVLSVDVSCASSCAPAIAPLQVPAVAHAQALAIDEGQVLLVGESTDATEGTRVVLLSNLTATPELIEVPLREKRSGAVAVAAFARMVAIAGGYSPVANTPVRSVEIFIPR